MAIKKLVVAAFILFQGTAQAGEYLAVESARQLSEIEEMKAQETRRVEREKKEKGQAECEAQYDACFDKAVQNLKSCGSADVCSQRYQAEKKACVTASELCEKQI